MNDGVESTIARRLNELQDEGDKLFEMLESKNVVEVSFRPVVLSWLYSSANLLEIAMPPGNRHLSEVHRLLPAADATIFTATVASVLGLLSSAAAEWRNGLLKTLELRFLGPAFEDFLVHAAAHNREGRRMEADDRQLLGRGTEQRCGSGRAPARDTRMVGGTGSV